MRAPGLGSEVSPDWLPCLNVLANDLKAEPDRPEEMKALRRAHPWAALPATVLNFPHDAPAEVAIA